MTVPVRGTIRLVNGRITEKVAAEIGERLIALEKALQGTGAAITIPSPAAPAFGGGAPGGPGTPGLPGTPGTPGATDHGALTGLEDDDHGQYLHRLDGLKPHAHSPDDVVGLEHRFLRRLEPARALPHVHAPEELGLDSRFYRRGERVQPHPHNHITADVSDLRPDDVQFVLAARMFGG